MRHILNLVGTVLLFSQAVFGQETSYPKGGYKTYEEFKNKKPSLPFEFKIERRKTGDIKMNGGNDYKISSSTIDKKTIKKELYAVSNGDTLFVNCFKHQAQWWYSQVLVEGKYLAFRGGISPTSKTRAHATLKGQFLGPVAGGIEGARAAMLRFLYVMKTDDGLIKLLDEKYLETLLENYPEAKAQYQLEPEKTKEEVLLKYLALINAREAGTHQ